MNNPPSSNVLKLPGLQQVVLDTPALEHLLHDLEEHAEVTEIVPKFPQRGYVAEGALSVADARKLLLFHSARGVQIRYRYDGAETWDTIMMAPEGFRLFRMHPELAPVG